MLKLRKINFLIFNILLIIAFLLFYLILLDINVIASSQNLGKSSFYCIALCYHNIKTKAENPYDVSLEEFEKQIKYLYENKFESLKASEVVQLIKSNENKEYKKYVCITFDDGNNGVYLYADKILSKYNFKATIYIYPSVIVSKREKKFKNYMSFDDIKKLLHNERYELGCHSYYHPFMTKEDKNGLILNTIKSKKTLIEQTGYEPLTFAYPFGLYNDEVVEYVKKAGFIGAFTIQKKNITKDTDVYKIPRYMILNSTSFNEFVKFINNGK